MLGLHLQKHINEKKNMESLTHFHPSLKEYTESLHTSLGVINVHTQQWMHRPHESQQQYSIVLTSTQCIIRALVTIPTSCIQIKHKHNKKKTLMVLPICRSQWSLHMRERSTFQPYGQLCMKFHSFTCSKNASLSIGVYMIMVAALGVCPTRRAKGRHLSKFLFAVQQSSKIILYWKPLKS